VKCRSAAFVAGLALACAACGGGSGSGQFAGLSRYDAENTALDALHQEEGDPSSPVYKETLLFAGAEHGQRPDGAQAWIVSLKTPAGQPSAYCVVIWSETKAAFQTRYGYGLVRCPGSV
jgi:hypothetical protein